MSALLETLATCEVSIYLFQGVGQDAHRQEMDKTRTLNHTVYPGETDRNFATIQSVVTLLPND